MNVSPREVLAGVGIILLTAVAVVRVAVPDRSRIRPLSIEAIDIPSEPIAQGEHIVRETAWQPPGDIYLMGWGYRVGSVGEITLYQKEQKLRLFVGHTDGRSANPAFFPPFTGFRLNKGAPITLRYAVLNTGPAGETGGANAFLYFVPVVDN